MELYIFSPSFPAPPLSTISLEVGPLNPVRLMGLGAL